jgi:hypothetical protein
MLHALCLFKSSFRNLQSQIRNPQCGDRPIVDPKSPILCKLLTFIPQASRVVALTAGPISNGYTSKKSFQCERSHEDLHDKLRLTTYCHKVFSLDEGVNKILQHFGKEFVSEFT